MNDTIELKYQVPADLMLAAAYSSSLNPNGRRQSKSTKGGSFKSIVYWTIFFLALIYLFNLLHVVSPRKDLVLGGFFGMAASLALYMIICTRINGRLKRLAADREHLRGETITTFGEIGFSYVTNHERYEVRWTGVDHIVELNGGTGIRIGAGTLPIPDSALPEGLSSEAFRSQLLQWKDAV